MQEKQGLDQPDHPDTLGSMANLASTYRSQGKWDKAHSLLLDVTNKMQHVIRPQDPTVLHYFKQHDEILKEKEHMQYQEVVPVGMSCTFPSK